MMSFYHRRETGVLFSFEPDISRQENMGVRLRRHGLVARPRAVLLAAFSEYERDVVVLFLGTEVQNFVDHGVQGGTGRE